jgi:hypothetical protein
MAGIQRRASPAPTSASGRRRTGGLPAVPDRARDPSVDPVFDPVLDPVFDPVAEPPFGRRTAPASRLGACCRVGG